MSIIVRLARQEELDEVFKLRFGVFLDPSSPAYFSGYERYRAAGTMADSTSYRCHHLIALDGHQIVGGIAIAQNGDAMLTERDEFHLDALEQQLAIRLTTPSDVAEYQRGFVLPRHRGRGIFRSLLDAADKELRSFGGKVAFGASKSGNSAIRAALIGSGWTHFATSLSDVPFDYLAKVV